MTFLENKVEEFKKSKEDYERECVSLRLTTKDYLRVLIGKYTWQGIERKTGISRQSLWKIYSEDYWQSISPETCIKILTTDFGFIYHG